MLKAQKINTSFLHTCALTYIGAFFNNFLFGAISGDVVKIYYISKTTKSLKLNSAITVFVDRVIGF